MGNNLSLKNILLKTCLLFVGFNLLFALLKPVPLLERLTGYNLLYPGRIRLPFGEVPEKAYNLSLYQIDAMFRSHEIARRKSTQEYRIVVIGDSSVWGYLLKPEQTLTAQLNAMQLTTPEGKGVKFFNLGYPTITLSKDILILQSALRYQPDAVIWLTTLEAFPKSKQLRSPILQHNPQRIRELIRSYHLDLDPQDASLVEPTFWDETIVGQRRPLADLLRLQLYGVLWAATGVDQFYPETYDPPESDLEPDEEFYNLAPPTLNLEDLSFDVLSAGVEMAGELPVLIVNEPIFLSQGENSNIRYNFFYPRWAYDQYRRLLEETCQENHWAYLDLWNRIPALEFTNSAIHLSPAATQQVAVEIFQQVQNLLEKEYDR